MPSAAFETAAARAGLVETTEVARTVPPGPATAEVLLHESPEGALTWHRPTDVAAVASSPGEVRRFVFEVVDRAVEAFETRHRPHRLRLFPVDEPVDLEALAEAGPVLLLVHGTGATAASTFHSLPASVSSALAERYDGRLVALEHPTVSVSPVDNVAWLDRQLAVLGERTLRVDVLAHSRGALVSRLLAERPDRTGGRLHVGRAVLVAAPNTGTTLASPAWVGHLLDRLTTLADLLPDHVAVDVLELLLTLVRQVAVGALEGLDGLAAMDPDGRFLTEVLNVPAARTPRYAAVAADYEPRPGSALGRVALDGLSDAVFDEVANDLVVPTLGSYDVPGLPGFPVRDRLVFAPEAGVDHNGYWAQPAFAEQVLGWLTPS